MYLQDFGISQNQVLMQCECLINKLTAAMWTGKWHDFNYTLQ